MNETPKTTRDQIAILWQLVRRALRHTWLVAVIVIVGAGLSVVLALLQKQTYKSETVLLYEEKISQSVLQGRDVVQSERKQSSRFREMLLSRSNLSMIIDEFNAYPKIVEELGTIAATELLRTKIEFRDSGAGTFRISYLGDSPEQAQQITARLASILQEQDESIRKSQAEQTKSFLENARTEAENKLAVLEAELAGFLALHPEFIREGAAQSAVGSSIRAAKAKQEGRGDGGRLSALQRAAQRLRDRIDNPNGPVTPVRTSRPIQESPAVREAREHVADAQRNLDAKSQLFTAKHPDVRAATNNLVEAQRRLKRALAVEARTRPPEPIRIKATTSVEDLKKELARIEAQIAKQQASASSAKPGGDALTNRLVDLETEHAQLERRVTEARQRLSSLEARVFTADITASSEFAEAAKLVVIDEAFLPARPAGRGRKLVVIAGTMAFAFIGMALALVLALLDDRIYQRADIDNLGIAPVLVVVPKEKKNRRGKRRG